MAWTENFKLATPRVYTEPDVVGVVPSGDPCTGCKYGTGECTMECMASVEVEAGLARRRAEYYVEQERALRDEARRQVELERRAADPVISWDDPRVVVKPPPGPWFWTTLRCMFFATWGLALAIFANLFLM